MTKALYIKALFFGALFIGVVLEVCGDILFKKWADGAGVWLIVGGALAYAAGSMFWAASLKYQDLSRAVGIFMMVNVLVVSVIGVVYFKEQLSLANKVGLLLALISIGLLEIG